MSENAAGTLAVFSDFVQQICRGQKLSLLVHSVYQHLSPLDRCHSLSQEVDAHLRIESEFSFCIPSGAVRNCCTWTRQMMPQISTSNSMFTGNNRSDLNPDFSKRLVQVLRFILDQGNYWHESKLVNKVTSLLVRLKSWTALDALLEEVRTQRVELDVPTYNALLKGYAASQRPEQAVKLLEEMTAAGLQPDAITYSGLMSAYVKAGDIGSAARLLDDMKASGVRPNAFHYSLLVHAYARADDLSGGLAISSKMAEEKVLPDRVLYNSLINLHCKAGSPLEALELLKEMTEIGLHPNNTSYTKVLEGLAKLGQGAEAEEVLKLAATGSVQPSLSMYSLVARAHTKSGDLAAAQGVLQRVIDAGITLDPDHIAFGTFGFLVREYVRKGDVGTAEDALQQIRIACASNNGGAIGLLEALVDESKIATQVQVI